MRSISIGGSVKYGVVAVEPVIFSMGWYYSKLYLGEGDVLSTTI